MQLYNNHQSSRLHIVLGAVFNNCTIRVGQKTPIPAPKRRRLVIESDDKNDMLSSQVEWSVFKQFCRAYILYRFKR